MIVLHTALLALSAQVPGYFPFVIPWDDAVKGVITDVSFLNAKPAGVNGRIVAKDSQFVEETTGKPVRFFGTNITSAMAFPSHLDAEKVAAHLAKMGVNIVRFHHLQAEWDAPRGGSIWKADKLNQEINPESLDRLDYFIYALKKQGIYSNVNLQTTRRYLPEMGFPKSVLEIPFSFCKKIDKVDRKMIQLQKQYAKDLLGRKNPYTGLLYKDDPAVAVIEINNENSLVGWPGEAPGAQLDTLPEPFRGEIVTAWNNWLAKRYPNDAAMRAAWSKGSTPVGPSLLNAASRWSFENHSNGDVKPTVTDDQLKNGAAPTITVQVNSNSGPDWHVQAHIPGLTLKNGDVYTVSFRGKCSQPAKVSIGATLDQEDWHNVGLSGSLDLSTEWKKYKFSFTCQSPVAGHNRVGFVLGNARGKIEIKDFSIQPGYVSSGENGSLEAKNVPMPQGGTKGQMADWTRFLADTETAYATEMRDYLRKDLGFKAMMIDTQISWGGFTSLQREKDSDFADNHAYWEHPSFPGKEWDSRNWIVRNTPMVNQLPQPGGEFASLAAWRVEGKPYSVSEYNHPAPSDYRAEMMPLYASFASLQSWNAIYTFDYGETTSKTENDKIQGFFAVSTDPAKMAFFPSMAVLFRQGLVPSPIPVGYSHAGKTTPWEPDFTPRASGISLSSRTRLTQDIRIYAGSDTGPSGEITKGKNGTVYLAGLDGAQVLVGFVGDGEWSTRSTLMIGSSPGARESSYRFPSFGNQFAAVSLVPMDGAAIQNSARMLLTLVGRVENQGMGWNADRTSVGNKWGHGPTVAEGIPCTVSLYSQKSLKVWALDGNGNRTRSVPVKVENGRQVFTVGPEYKTLWYEVGA